MTSSSFLCIGTPAYKKTPLIYRFCDDLDKHLNATDIKFYVTDDSRDGTVQDALDDRVKYERNGTGNAIHNWNKVIQFSKNSRWCWLLHHDEYINNIRELHEECLTADAKGADIIIFDILVHSQNRSRRLSRQFIKRLVTKFPSTLFISNLIGSPSAVCVRSEAYEEYDTNLTWLVDVENYYRLLTQGRKSVYFSNLQVISVVDAENSITSSLTNIKKTHIDEVDNISLASYKKFFIKLLVKLKYQLKRYIG